jgi:hypothetical protein
MSAGAAINTKVELVVEGVEDLANAIFDGRDTDRHDKAAVDRVAGAILEKRGALRDALRDFLAPRVRLIQGGKGAQPYAAGTEDGDKPRCLNCMRFEPCPLGKGTQCDHWASALRRKHQEAHDAVDPTEGDRA